MDIREIRQRLRGSLDMAFVKQILLEYFILAAIVLGCFGVFTAGSGENGWLFAACMYVLCSVPFLIFSLWRTIRIFRKSAFYRFYRCKLCVPHNGYKGLMYFTVVLEDPDGSKMLTNTHSIFQTYGMWGPQLENYVNQTVTIGYNGETETTVVIG